MDHYTIIKNKLIDNEINKKVKDYTKNKYELNTYYEVGKLLIDAQGGETRAKYGNKLIKEYSIRLTKELGKGYGERNLRNMRQFYLLLKDKNWQPMAAKLNWTQICILMTIKDTNKLKYYFNLSVENNLTKRQLQEAIKQNDYERLPDSTKLKLIDNKELELSDEIKNPIVIKNSFNVEKISEKILQKLIIEDIQSIMKQLGNGYSFIDNEYKIKIGNTYNYIDLLLFNYVYNCFVVIELKVTEFKKEHIGQIKTYMNYVDKHLKNNFHNNTIGIIIVKKNNKYYLEYISDNRINIINYILL